MALLHVRRMFSAVLLGSAALGLSPANALAQTGILTGKVIDAINGKPLANAQVQLLVPGGSSYGAVSGETDFLSRADDQPR